jgi:hypothetical protein
MRVGRGAFELVNGGLGLRFYADLLLPVTALFRLLTSKPTGPEHHGGVGVRLSDQLGITVLFAAFTPQTE